MVNMMECISTYVDITINYEKPWQQRAIYLWDKADFNAIRNEIKGFSSFWIFSIDTDINKLWLMFKKYTQLKKM